MMLNMEGRLDYDILKQRIPVGEGNAFCHYTHKKKSSNFVRMSFVAWWLENLAYKHRL